MMIYRVQDQFNDDKIWLIKKSNCSHYYLNQEIKGNKLNSKFIRVTKTHLQNIGVMEWSW